MMCKVLIDHLFRQLTCCYTKIASCPKMTVPIALFHMRKLGKNLAGSATFYPSHNLRWRHIGRCRHKYVHMIFADNSTQYLNLKIFARLTHQITYSFRKISLEHMIAVLGCPYKLVFNLIFSMTSCPTFHARKYITTASFKLPA